MCLQTAFQRLNSPWQPLFNLPLPDNQVKLATCMQAIDLSAAFLPTASPVLSSLSLQIVLAADGALVPGEVLVVQAQAVTAKGVELIECVLNLSTSTCMEQSTFNTDLSAGSDNAIDVLSAAELVVSMYTVVRLPCWGQHPANDALCLGMLHACSVGVECMLLCWVQPDSSFATCTYIAGALTCMHAGNEQGQQDRPGSAHADPLRL